MGMKNMGHLIRFGVIYGAVIVILSLIAGCGEESSNSPPVIDSFEASSTDVVTNSEVILTVSATDDDGDDLTYTYQSTGGTISGTGNVVTWIAPATAGNYTITVDISDGELNVQDIVTITVVTPETPPVSLEGMVFIPAGEFEMGDSLDRITWALPVHTVYLDAFYMDIYEVTNAQYQKFMEATGRAAHRHLSDPKYRAPEQPVVGVNWHDAVAYAKWAGKRLPTEAEWEKAARGGLVGKRFPWGNRDPDGSQCNFADMNLDYIESDNSVDDGFAFTAPVGRYLPNGYGLYDIAGNVWEWCADWYDENYYANSPTNNPLGPDSGTVRVVRGGSFATPTHILRVALRSAHDPAYAEDGGIGFRCVFQD